MQAVDAPAHGGPLTHRAKGLIVYLCCADAAEFAELLHSLARLGEHFNRRPRPPCPRMLPRIDDPARHTTNWIVLYHVYNGSCLIMFIADCTL